jgi:protein-tyrosine phosphatase
MDDFNDKNRYNDVNYFVIPIKDESVCSKDMTNVFDAATQFIYDSLKNNENILVHCKRGHHRSGAIVAAYLVKYLKIKLSSSVLYINSLRPCALRRDTCMSRALFKYNLKVNGIAPCDEHCGKHDNAFYCECSK